MPGNSAKRNDIILAGGSDANEVKLFDRSNNNKSFCCVHELQREIVTVNFSHDDKMFAISGAYGMVRVFRISES
jgi:WD40 repeat protein